MQSLNIEYIFQKLYKLITEGFSAGPGTGEIKNFVNIVDNILTFIFSIIAIIAITVILYVIVRKMEMSQEKAKKLSRPLEADIEPMRKNDRWQKVLDHVYSQNPSDWRLAIIEADTILEEMVTRMGYKGDNLGEKLKSVEPSDFNTLQDAWGAHKVRNKIAHEGLNFQIDHREAKRVIALFEKVFKEFEFI
ncbi:MAG: hypothetical protein QG580_50 [Patescibacteria group bacterium]|jgi:hypothetical protein|nr:hypothetical protein [Patescibacteria group bacterium]